MGEIKARREGPLQWLIISNPARLNAMSLEMSMALREHLIAAERDDEVRVVLLTGDGPKAFMSGADLSEFETHRSTKEKARRTYEIGEQLSATLRGLGKPTLAVIRGWCVGGGLSLAMDCDLRVCSDNARFFQAVAKLAQGFSHGFTKRMIEVVGAGAAREIFLTGRRYDAAGALRIGLVNQVVADGELDAFIAEYAGAIAENAPLSLLSCKRTIEQIMADPAKCDLALIRRLYDDCLESADYAEAARAFAEKRKPRFVGH